MGDIICNGCGEPCTVVSVDFGIGAYEYWGAPGFDSRVELVSNCCEADFGEDPGPDEPDEDYDPDLVEVDDGHYDDYDRLASDWDHQRAYQG